MSGTQAESLEKKQLHENGQKNIQGLIQPVNASTQILQNELGDTTKSGALTSQQPTLDTSSLQTQKQSEIAEREKKLVEEAQKNEEDRKKLAEKEKELNERERKLAENEKAVKEERVRLSIMAEKLDKNAEDELWVAANADALEKIEGKLVDVDQQYRAKAAGLYYKQHEAVKKIQAKINSYRLKPGKNGLTRDRELKLRSEIINEKSKARKEYIKLTIQDKDKQEHALLEEKRRELRMLADLYRKLQFFGKLKEAEDEEKALEDKLFEKGLALNMLSLKQKEITQDWIIREEVEEDTKKKEKTGKKEEKKEDKKEEKKEDKKEEQQEDQQGEQAKKEKVEINFEGLEKFYPVLKEIGDQRKKTLTALYVFVKREDRKAWLKQHEDFEAPKLDDITTIITDLIELWKTKWGKDINTLIPDQKTRLTKDNKIPEVDNETVDLAVLRQIVTGLHEAAYNLVEFQAKPLPVFDRRIKLYGGDDQPAAEVNKLRGYKYEKQKRGNDCWICALDALVNFSLTKDAEPQAPAEETLLKQDTVRDYKPQFRKDPNVIYVAQGNETKKQKAEREKQRQESKYTHGENEINQYMKGKATSRPGNIFALSDLIHEKAGKKAIRCITFDISKSKEDDVAGDGKRNAYNNVKAKFIDVVKTALTNGRPLAVLVGMHYRVITEADGNGMMLLNSNPNMANGEVPYAEEMSYDDLFKDTQRAVELTYLDDITDPAKLARDFEGLQYDAQQQKFSLAQDVDPLVDPEEVAINNGVVIHQKREKMPAEIADYVHEKVCVPSSMQDQPAAN